jgi:beta-1,2-mannobiose phosphorylase / 1,2-beta-oligomannan phosphorylase
LGVITSEGSDNKVLFPEKIKKYFFLHRRWVGPKFGIDKPSIWIGEGTSSTKFENHTILMKPEYD